MIVVNATNLRNNLFELLSKVASGETIAIQRNGERVAIISPAKEEDWRNKIRAKPKLTVSPGKAFAPIEDVWENYL